LSARLAYPLLALGALLAAVVAIGTVTLLLAFSLLSGAEQAVLAGPTSPGAPAAANPAPSAQARADIPPLYLALYVQAATRFGLDWAILAGIGRVECDHGRDPAPSCTVEGQLNSAGAGGPAQFLVSTWQRYGISATGTGPPDMWRPSDAIFSMANYLRASGAPGDYPRAIYAYNHAWWYVAEVLAWARLYSARYGSERTQTRHATQPRQPPPPPAHARAHRPARNIRAPKRS
jgi:hypothetical protein